MTPFPADGLCRVCQMSRIHIGITLWLPIERRASMPVALRDAVLWICGWPACEEKAKARALVAAKTHKLARPGIARVYSARPIPEVKL